MSTPSARPPQILTCQERAAFRRRDHAREVYVSLAWRLRWATPWEQLDGETQQAWIEALRDGVEEEPE